MDRSRVSEIVDANIKPMMDVLQVQHWSIGVALERIDCPHTLARVDRWLDYHKATIILDPEKMGDEEDVLRTLRHELIHVLLAPFDLYAQTIAQAISGDERLERLDSRLFDHAQEQAVLCIERLLDHGVVYRPWDKKKRKS